MSEQSIRYYALCRNQARIDQWKARAVEIPGVEFHFWTGFDSMYAFIQKAIEDCPSPFLVIAHDDVIVGRDFAYRVQSLLNELEATFPNWGVVGNAGVNVDGRVCVYVKDPWSVPQLSQGSEPVASIDGNLMLVNRRLFMEAGCEFPDLGGFHGYDVVFSFECLRKGLMVLADGRLRAVHLSGGNRGVYGQYINASLFQRYFRERFSDPFIPTMLGLQAVTGQLDVDAPLRPSLRSLQDLALSQAKQGQICRLAIIDCRPDPTPPLALEIPPEMANLLDISKIGINADSAPAKMSGLLSVPVGSGMGGIVQEAFRCLPHDYFWFVTETVNCKPNVLSFVARTVAGKPDALVIGTYCTNPSNAPLPRLQDSTALMLAIFQAGHFPLSALIIPTLALRETIRQTPLNRYDVDGALLGAMALATPGIRFVPMPARINILDIAPPITKPNLEAYGKDEDWEYIERSALFNKLATRGNLSLWAMAKDAALAEPPSSAMRWAQDIQSVWQAGRQVLSQPGSYLKRGVSLAFGYLIHGDIKGLIREARLFRPR
ncbi:MAG: hypothetical protein PHH59_06280 [Methylovulum sp.]|uniref:hypothetical protein n=1 Tax=Methylovulum sp. TaxID=1916980 RepID=UPI0026305107|nr:hypothetical protein [Methylovulum sp.]MDD2723612.1 hypothetical protein [Methylovulum sp.]MDD5124323.1 hypothetical protein [Methylovulum sp.]